MDFEQLIIVWSMRMSPFEIPGENSWCAVSTNENELVCYVERYVIINIRLISDANSWCAVSTNEQASFYAFRRIDCLFNEAIYTFVFVEL